MMTQFEKEVLKALKTIEKGIANMAKQVEKATKILASIDWNEVAAIFPQIMDNELDVDISDKPITDEPDVTEDDLPFQ